MKTIQQTVLEACEIVYLITDNNFLVQAWHGDVEVVGLATQTLNKAYLPEIVPELFGLEDILTRILKGELPYYRLDFINRKTTSINLLYFNMTTVPYQMDDGSIQGVIHIIQNATRLGQLHRDLVQQRNELRLLHKK